MADRPRILAAAGGTAGHVVPTLAVADVLADRGAEVHFAGTPDRVEATLVPAAGYPFHPIEARGFERRLSVGTARSLGALAAAPVRASRLLARVRPDGLLGGGGYVSGPVVGLGALRGIPAVVCEADSHLGVTNRLLARVVDRVCLAFPLPGREPPRYVVTGRPLPAAVRTADAGRARAALGLDGDRSMVLVYGGSLGARRLNDAAVGGFGDPGRRFDVVHVSGRRDHADLVGRVAGRAGYHLLAWTDALADLQAAADVVVSRSGGSVAETAALGRPSILVPFPAATADHQTANARHLVGAGAAVLVPDAELDAARLRAEVDALLADPDRRARMSAAALAWARPDAAERVADELWALIEARAARGGAGVGA